ncbi:MAG TPA: pyridoxamine 5'-phosphate oxidase family protein [Blastocatellia bacterium]|nr:pyridoxamine 5'-phosphate oxidase family protein [Blastocatellia bacterium]
MVIHEMTLEECRDVLAQGHVARLVCEMDDQPYAVPVYLAYDGTYLFGFATMGYKIDCMRSNPLVCVEIDEVKSENQWMSVVVFGKYEELADTPEYETTRAHAHELLQKRAMWWEPACVAVEHTEFPKTFAPIFYRIHIDRMTGHRALPDTVDHPAAPAAGQSWLRKLLDRVLPS